jgi:hypothetical protein
MQFTIGSNLGYLTWIFLTSPRVHCLGFPKSIFCPIHLTELIDMNED